MHNQLQFLIDNGYDDEQNSFLLFF